MTEHTGPTRFSVGRIEVGACGRYKARPQCSLVHCGDPAVMAFREYQDDDLRLCARHYDLLANAALPGREAPE